MRALLRFPPDSTVTPDSTPRPHRNCSPGFLCVIVATLALAPAGCGRNQPRPGQLPPSGSVLFIIGPSEFDSRWPAIRGGARRALREAPYLKGEFANVQNADRSDLAALVQRAADRKALALCLYSDDAAADRDAIRMATRSEMKVILMGCALSTEGAVGIAQFNLPRAAALLSRNLADLSAGRLSYVLLHGNGESELGTRCFLEFGTTPLDRPSLRLLDDVAVTGDAAAWQKAVQSILQRFPNVGLVVTLDPKPWLSEAPRLRLPESSRFATLSAAPGLWPRLRSGEAAALVGVCDGELAYQATRMAIATLIGTELDGAVRTIPHELVTAATLDDFSRRYAEAGELNPPEAGQP